MELNDQVHDRWIREQALSHLNINIDQKKRVTIRLPPTMNFTTNFETSVIHLMAIRRLTRKGAIPPGGLRLRRVEFEDLRFISTSAALVLTAELAKWEDALQVKLNPNVESWDENISQQFAQLGFFNLFEKSPDDIVASTATSDRHLVQYIKGKFREHSKPRLLQERLDTIVGNEIDEWEFLHSGLVEAIINVTHHAYPKSGNYKIPDMNWYLTGSYDVVTRQLKIVFYDQGITIPKSLPATNWGEKILHFASTRGIASGINDSTLVSAAMEMSRTRTDESDRGKGLQDILEFVKQRQQGYLAVVSGRGFFRFDVNHGSEKTTAHPIPEPLLGTLIVWNVKLEKPE